MSMSRSWVCAVAGLGIASCAVTDVNSLSIADQVAIPLEPACLQAAILSIPGQSPSLQRGHWVTDSPDSGGTKSNYAFTLPELEGIPGPHENALYWVQSYDFAERCDLFWCTERRGLVFTSVVWTEPYPQSASRADELEDRLIAIRQRFLDVCGSTLLDRPECRRSHQGGSMVIENACDPDGQPDKAMPADAPERRR